MHRRFLKSESRHSATANDVFSFGRPPDSCTEIEIDCGQSTVNVAEPAEWTWTLKEPGGSVIFVAQQSGSMGATRLLLKKDDRLQNGFTVTVGPNGGSVIVRHYQELPR